MGNYSVYKHTSPCGKVYIGITGADPSKRWQNGKGYKGNAHFWRAICRYGWDSFSHDIIVSGIEKHEAAEIEKKLIEEYHSNEPGHGYNITAGGETNILPASSLEKISKANRGQVFSIETRKRMSESRKALLKAHPEYAATRTGYKMSADHKRKLSAASVSATRKRILCVETGTAFPSLTSASISIGVSMASLSEALHGKQKRAGGYSWRFIEVVK